MKRLNLILVLTLVVLTEISAQPCLPGGINFSTQSMIDNFIANHPFCNVIEGDVRILGNDITNVDSLKNIIGINGHLEIWMNPNLTNLTGLSNLTYVGDFLMISENPMLVSFTGLNNLATIGGDLFIEENDQISNLDGFESLTTIGGAFEISLNENLQNLSGINNLSSMVDDLTIYSNSSLVNLSGLDNLSSDITYLMIVHDSLLTDITALHNINSVSTTLSVNSNYSLTNLSGLESINLNNLQHLEIKKNPQLSECAIQNICAYLSDSIGTVSIFENAAGCNSREEVDSVCQLIDIQESTQTWGFSIYPNPANKEIYISNNRGGVVKRVIIYNQLGQKVFDKREIANNKIDVSTLRRGIYVVEMESNNLKLREKLILNE